MVRMPEIPSNDGHELITKGFLREEFARFRGDRRANVGGLRGDLAAFERSLTRRMLAAQNVIVSAVWLLT